MFGFLVPFFGYASTFYRFKYFFSLLKKRHPQIIADVPHRVNKTKYLPVLFIVRNADIYPSRLLSVEILIDNQSAKKITINKNLSDDYWDHIERIDISSFENGYRKINIRFSYKIRNKIFVCFNDNYRRPSHKAIPCYFSDTVLPSINGFYHAEMHSHSNYTNDQIEFGASIESTAAMAEAVGMNVICITDHSYDLDDMPDNFLINDPELNKWKAFKNEVKQHNENQPAVLVIAGEEVSVRNRKNENVHLLVYNDDHFFEGNGDSGEKWFHYYSRNSITDVTRSLSNKAMAFAAHPTDEIPGMHHLLLNRGKWSVEDSLNEELCGVQILNGHGKDKTREAISYWTKILLKNKQRFALAGNDAHGNFGVNRSIHVPFLTISETYTQLFGLWRTDIFLGDKPLTVDNTVEALRTGNYTLTNGPALDFFIIDALGDRKVMGSKGKKPIKGCIKAVSNKEFGKINKVIVWLGDIKNSREVIYKNISCSDNFDLDKEFEITNETQLGYFRVEISSSGPKGEHHAFSNPIWFHND